MDAAVVAGSEDARKDAPSGRVRHGHALVCTQVGLQNKGSGRNSGPSNRIPLGISHCKQQLLLWRPAAPVLGAVYWDWGASENTFSAREPPFRLLRKPVGGSGGTKADHRVFLV